MDRRKSSYDKVIDDFGQYCRDFESFVVKGEEPKQESKQKTKKHRIRYEPDYKLPDIKLLQRYQGRVAANLAMST